jgi:cysteinyl-tRNA synthetase
MSKRFGNILTVKDLREQDVDPRAFRQLALSTRYSKDLNFTDEALHGAAEGVRKLGEARRRLRELREVGGTAQPPASEAAPEAAAELGRSFRAALDDDLNTPQGLEALFTFSREANRAMDSQAWSPGQAAAALTEFETAREVLFGTPKLVVDVALRLSRIEVDGKVAEREAARRARDFARADAIRKELADIGIELKDTPSGPRVERRGASEDDDG